MYTSRLSKSLADVFNDRQAVGYLLQFMDVHNVRHLVQFWLDAESFRATAISRISVQARANESLPVSNASAPVTDAGKLNGGSAETILRSPLSRDGVAKNRLSGIDIDVAVNSQNHSNFSKVPYNISSSDVNCAYSGGSNVSDSVNRPGSLSANNHISTTERSSQNGFGYNPHESSPASIAATTIRRLPSEKELDFRLRLQKSIEKDAVAIFSRYIAHDAPQPIGVTEQLRNEAISRICGENNQVDVDCFVSCQQFVLNVINNEYFPSFKESVYYLRHQADILTRCDVTLRDVLYNQSALFYFTEFMEREGARTLFQCWSDLESFRQLLHSQGCDDPSNATQIQDDAIIIYDRYFSLQALNPIGFPDIVRQEVESNICAEDGVQPGCFDTAHQQVMQRMDRDYFQQFLKSDVFVRFLSDLVSSVQSLIASPAPRLRQRQVSDAGSVHSSSSVGDAVVASPTSSSSSASAAFATAHTDARLQKVMSRVQDDMKIDDNLLRPESLWRRSNVGSMSLGKVDKLGRFISEVDPEPDGDKKKKTPFFKMNLFKDQAAQNDEEEMAHQIADMIIREVTHVTK